MKKAAIIIAFLILFVSFPSYTFAHQKAENHYEDIEYVLFGTDTSYIQAIKANKDKKEKLQAIEYAATLAIDQYNGYNDKLLTWLNDMGVSDLPPNVTVTRDEDPKGINYTASPNEHRKYTHKGWDLSPSPYLPDKANWTERRNIMLAAAEFAFGFKPHTYKPDAQCDAFCALIYYIHIIGDQEEDSMYATAEVIIPLGRRNEENTNNSNESNPDIYSQLEYYLPQLFKDQKDSLVYKAMMLHLKVMSKQVRKLDEGGSVREENRGKYQKYAKKTITVLGWYIPKLLKNEKFFTAAFSPEQ